MYIHAYELLTIRVRIREREARGDGSEEHAANAHTNATHTERRAAEAAVTFMDRADDDADRVCRVNLRFIDTHLEVLPSFRGDIPRHANERRAFGDGICEVPHRRNKNARPWLLGVFVTAALRMTGGRHVLVVDNSVNLHTLSCTPRLDNKFRSRLI